MQLLGVNAKRVGKIYALERKNVQRGRRRHKQVLSRAPNATDRKGPKAKVQSNYPETIASIPKIKSGHTAPYSVTLNRSSKVGNRKQSTCSGRSCERLHVAPWYIPYHNCAVYIAFSLSLSISLSRSLNLSLSLSIYIYIYIYIYVHICMCIYITT